MSKLKCTVESKKESEGGRKNRMVLRKGERLHSKLRSLSATEAGRGREKEREAGREREEGPVLSTRKQRLQHQMKCAKR